jgi:release factor glutamine methyltransferase
VGGSDISKAALKVAKKNALTLGARIDLRKGHLLKAWGDLGGVDLIISNPPYLWKNHEFVAKEALDWEPALALFPKRNRRSKLRNVGAHLAEEMLNLCEAMERFKGSIAMELSARVAYDLERTFKRSLGFARVERREDLNGRKRFLVCEKGLGGT